MLRLENEHLTQLTSVLFVLVLACALAGFDTTRASVHSRGFTLASTSSPFMAGPQGMLDPPSNVGIVGEATPDRQQVEPTIAIDPRNPDIIVAGAQDLRLVGLGQHRWHGYYRSTDAGNTWSTGLLPGSPDDASIQGLSSPLHRSNATSDPVLAFDRAGNVYYAGLVFNISSTGKVGSPVVFVAKYVNDGTDYSGVTLVTGPLFSDKEWIAVDTTGGPNDGNVYMAFDGNLTATSYFGTLFTRSTDGGQTFSSPFYAPSDETGELPGVAVDPAGNVYVSTDAFNPVTALPLNYIQVSKITNGGTTLAQTVRAVNPGFLLESSPQGGSFRAFTIPQIAADGQGAYLVWDDVRLGNTSVFFTRSTKGGLSWTSPLRISDVVFGQHFFPTIAVSGGIINVAWFDSRLNTGTSMSSLDLFYAYSVNGGMSFSSNSRVTSVSSNPEQVLRTDLPGANSPFIGDYIQIAANPKTAHVIWPDNRNACDALDPTYGCVDQDVFTATISLPDLSISANPVSVTVVQGLTRTVNVTVASLNEFSGNVSASVSSSPEGLPVTPVSTTVALPPGGLTLFELTISPTNSTTPGLYAANVTATLSPRSRSVLLSITVQRPQAGGGTTPTNQPGELAYLWPAVGISIGALIAVAAFMLIRKRNLGKMPHPNCASQPGED